MKWWLWGSSCPKPPKAVPPARQQEGPSLRRHPLAWPSGCRGECVWGGGQRQRWGLPRASGQPPGDLPHGKVPVRRCGTERQEAAGRETLPGPTRESPWQLLVRFSPPGGWLPRDTPSPASPGTLRETWYGEEHGPAAGLVPPRVPQALLGQGRGFVPVLERFVGCARSCRSASASLSPSGGSLPSVSVLGSPQPHLGAACGCSQPLVTPGLGAAGTDKGVFQAMLSLAEMPAAAPRPLWGDHHRSARALVKHGRASRGPGAMLVGATPEQLHPGSPVLGARWGDTGGHQCETRGEGLRAPHFCPEMVSFSLQILLMPRADARGGAWLGLQLLYPWTSERGAEIAVKKRRGDLCHLNNCLLCQHRHSVFGGFVEGSRGSEPGQTIFTLSWQP